jgi:hypothetical protein
LGGVVWGYIDGVLELEEVGFLEAYWGWDVEVGEKPGDDAHNTVTSLELSASLNPVCGGWGYIGDAKEADAGVPRVGRDFRLNLLERYNKLCYRVRLLIESWSLLNGLTGGRDHF